MQAFSNRLAHTIALIELDTDIFAIVSVYILKCSRGTMKTEM